MIAQKTSTLVNTSIYKIALEQDKQDRLRRQDEEKMLPLPERICFVLPRSDPAYPVLFLLPSLASKASFAIGSMLLLLLLCCGCSKPPPVEKPPPYIRITQPRVADVPLYFEYVGHVEPNLTVNIKAQVTGLLTGQYFVEGQEVSKNSLLMTIDPRPFQAELDRNLGVLAENLATLEQARDTLKRNQPLAALNYISQLDYDQFITNVLTAEAAVEQAKAEVETARIDLSYCSIEAPFQGVASKLAIDVGNYVPIGGNTPLLTINQISPIRISFFVPEKDLLEIAPLQNQCPLVTRALRDQLWVEGKLFLINNAVDEATGMILLQAVFENSDRALWPGEFVDVRLILKTAKNAILVPSPVVQIGQDGPYVYVVKPNQTVEMRRVVVGQKEESETIIVSGLGAHETVVSEGQLNLKSGIKVLIKP